MALPRAASDYAAARSRLIVATLAQVGAEWSRMSDDLESSWANIGPRIAVLTAAAQLGAARDGLAYVPRALAEQGQSVAPVARVEPRGLAGVASDGRTLDSLLYGAVVHARSAKVASLPERLTIGRKWLDLFVKSTVADAGRDAATVAVTVRPGVQWVRIVTPPCCQRCAVLAGRVYRYSQGFDRHPGCDCSMLPQTVANPDAAGMVIGPDDVTDLTKRQRKDIADGADFNKTVNDYNRKRGDYSPPTRVEKAIVRAGQREKALAALADIGIVIP